MILCYGSKVHLTCFPGWYLVMGLLVCTCIALYFRKRS
jgi:hypothetical protein